MKKRFLVLLAMPLMLSLAACSGANPSSSGDASSQPPVLFCTSSSIPSQTPVSSEVAVSDTLSFQPEESTEEGATLVAYFSWSGNTQQMAEIIAQETRADLFDTRSRVSRLTPTITIRFWMSPSRNRRGRPSELNAQVEDWDRYDTIFVGYPNWWNDAPMAVYTFLESYDFTGKTLIPFNTSASGGFGRSLSGIEESATGATILEGLDLTEGELGDAQNRVTTWLDRPGPERISKGRRQPL